MYFLLAEFNLKFKDKVDQLLYRVLLKIRILVRGQGMRKF